MLECYSTRHSSTRHSSFTRHSSTRHSSTRHSSFISHRHRWISRIDIIIHLTWDHITFSYRTVDSLHRRGDMLCDRPRHHDCWYALHGVLPNTATRVTSWYIKCMYMTHRAQSQSQRIQCPAQAAHRAAFTYMQLSRSPKQLFPIALGHTGA